jgi:hypothetical protein
VRQTRVVLSQNDLDGARAIFAQRQLEQDRKQVRRAPAPRLGSCDLADAVRRGFVYAVSLLPCWTRIYPRK